MTKVPVTIALRGHAKIRAAAQQHASLFVRHPTPQEAARSAAGRLPFRPPSHYGYAWDRCAVLPYEHTPASLRGVIARTFEESEIPTSFSRFALVRYEPGDYLFPHREDTASSLFSLTSSTEDGLIVQREGGEFVRIPDRAGRHVVVSPGQWHWVDPVRRPRLTLMVSPPLEIPPG
ncbi:MAG: hypothetical protein R6X02_07000 [Enhygromyxa sp.]